MITPLRFAGASALLFAAVSALAQTSWNQNAAGIWGTAANWTPTSVAGGPDAADITVNITNNITSARIVTLFNTADGGDAVKTVGILNIGDSDTSHSFTIATGTGAGSLDFNKSGGAQLNQVSGSAANTISAPISLSSGVTIANASSTALTLSGLISGGNSITVNSAGSGGVIFSANTSTYSGGTTLSAGLLILQNSTAATPTPPTVGPLGTGTLILNGGILASNAGTSRVLANNVTLGGNVTFGQTVTGTGLITLEGTTTLTDSRTMTVDGVGVALGGAAGRGDVISSSSQLLTKSGAGDLSFDNMDRANFAGGIYVTAGSLTNKNTNSSGASLTNRVFGTGSIRFAGGTTYNTINAPIHNNIQLDGVLTITGDSGGGNVKRFTGNITGVGSLLATSNNGTSTVNLSGSNNAFSGGVTMTETAAGTPALIAVSSNALGTGVTTMNNGQLRIGGIATSASAGTTAANQNIDGLAGVVGTSVIGNSSVVGGSTVTISPSSGSSTFAGVIGGVGTNNNNLNIVMNGAPSTSQTFSGSNLFTGTTVISGGTLIADNDKALGNTSSVTVNGGIFDVRGLTAGTVTLGTSGDVSMSAGSMLFQLATVSDQVVGTGANSFYSFTGGSLQLDVAGAGFSYSNSYTIFSGFGGANSVSNLIISGYDSSNWTATLDSSGTINFAAAIPEPSVYATLAGFVAVGLAACRRRRQV